MAAESTVEQARTDAARAAVPGDEPTIGRLVNDATRDLSTLIRKEIELAKTELKVSVKFGLLGAGLLIGAAFTATLFIILASITAAYLINWKGHGLALQWGYLIVTVFWLIVTVVAALVGIKKFKNVGPPERAIEQGKGIPKAVRGKK